MRSPNFFISLAAFSYTVIPKKKVVMCCSLMSLIFVRTAWYWGKTGIVILRFICNMKKGIFMTLHVLWCDFYACTNCDVDTETLLCAILISLKQQYLTTGWTNLLGFSTVKPTKKINLFFFVCSKTGKLGFQTNIVERVQVSDIRKHQTWKDEWHVNIFCILHLDKLWLLVKSVLIFWIISLVIAVLIKAIVKYLVWSKFSIYGWSGHTGQTKTLFCYQFLAHLLNPHIHTESPGSGFSVSPTI